MKKTEQTDLEEQAERGIKMFLSSFAVGITNPAAILTFLFAFSYFGIVGKTGVVHGIQLVAGVFIGTCIWWCLLSAAVIYVKKKWKPPFPVYESNIWCYFGFVWSSCICKDVIMTL